MCTMIVATNYFKDTPLLVAGNRDEWLNRPSAPPEVRYCCERGELLETVTTEGSYSLSSSGQYLIPSGVRLLDAASRIPVLAPLDLKAHGTWLGLNAFGVFVGITNRYGQPPDPSRRSRGELVLQALSCRSAIEAFDLMKRTNPVDFNRFHLVMADREKAFLLWSDGERLHPAELNPGIHVITERSLVSTMPVREQKLRAKLSLLPREKAPDEAVLHEMLAQHDDDPFNGTCVHLPGQVYGTRSSTLLWLFADETTRFLHAEGPPCQSVYQDYSSQAVFT